MRQVDQLVNATRRVIEMVLPWYDPAEAKARRKETERIRQTSIDIRQEAEGLYPQLKRRNRALREMDRLEQMDRGRH